MSSTARSNERLSLDQRRCNPTAVLFLRKFSGVHRYPQQQKWNWRKLLVLKAFGSKTTTLLTHSSRVCAKHSCCNTGICEGTAPRDQQPSVAWWGWGQVHRSQPVLTAKSCQRIDRGYKKVLWGFGIHCLILQISHIMQRIGACCKLDSLSMCFSYLEENISAGRDTKQWKIKGNYETEFVIQVK